MKNIEAHLKFLSTYTVSLVIIVVLFNFCCTSNDDIFKPYEQPVITMQPMNQTVDETKSVTFSIAASGKFLTYQWQKNNADIAGATETSYSINNVTYDQNGATYRCIVSNPGGSVTSNTSKLIVNPIAPIITLHPQDQTVTEEQTATFSVSSSGIDLAYQWKKNNNNIPGATTATYTTPAATLSDNGALFCCVISNGGGVRNSNSAKLTVNSKPLVITLQPSNQTVNVGQTAQFSVTATSSSPITYQWQKNSADISNATAATYTTPSTSIVDNGSTYKCVVSNTGGSVTSNTATLTVKEVDGNWLQYDDDSFEAQITVGSSSGGYLWIRFSRPQGWSATKVTKIMINVKSGSSYEFNIDCCDSYNYHQVGSNYWYTPSGSFTNLVTDASQSTGWYTYNVSHTFNSSEFFIGLWCGYSGGPYFGIDTHNSSSLVAGVITGSNMLCCVGAIWGVRVFAVPSKNSYPSSKSITIHKDKDKEKWLESSISTEIHTSELKGNFLISKGVKK